MICSLLSVSFNDRYCFDKGFADRVCSDRVCFDKVCFDKVCFDKGCVEICLQDFPAYRTRNGVPYRPDTMNVMETAVEKTFLAIDPRTRVENHRLQFKSKF